MMTLVDETFISVKSSPPPVPLSALHRPRVSGKFIYVDDQKLYVRGATYGTFRPDEDGYEYPQPEVVERDFALMAANGVNAIRTYTVPPGWLLDAAQRHNLRVMVGLPVERYIGFLTDKKNAPDVEGLVRSGVQTCAGHPAVLCFVIGNELPASVVRWYGRRRIECYLKRLYQAAKAEDPYAIVTYVNYPSTEYLQLPFLDLVCFNVYLESPEQMEAYLARLQNIAGERPLIMSEIGLDSRRNGEEAQAHSLDWQVRTAFEAGCAGLFVYAWTDEWHRGGEDVEDWDFGLTRRDRSPKPALDAVRAAFAEVPFPRDFVWPRVSVVVCTRNGSQVIRQCLARLLRLEYPDFEVIVVDDGSQDDTARIAGEYDVRVITTQWRGLSHARDTGMKAATGEIVAYIDDDAYPDPHWLQYMAATFMKTKYVGVGGPNFAPPGDGLIAACVANAPGNPTHVLLSDQQAEHIPGCNMAFRKSALEAIEGFDHQFRIAGDDVDVCWRLQQKGWELGFSPAAFVWHRRRPSVRAFWRQQYNYGKAEALLGAKWPEKYNAVGHLIWAGRIYDETYLRLLNRAGRIYHGVWGSAPFQSLYQPASSLLSALPLMPEWFLLGVALAGLSALGTLWKPLLLALPVLIIMVGVSLVQAGVAAAQASFVDAPPSRLARLSMLVLTGALYLLQPLARLRGRMEAGLTPWRQYGWRGFLLPWPRSSSLWTEHGKAPDRWLQSFEEALRADGLMVLRGGEFDRWDLQVQGGALGAVRMLMAVEEHGGGRQLVRFQVWPTWSNVGLSLSLASAALAAGAATSRVWLVTGLLGVAGVIAAWRGFQECASATWAVMNTVQDRVNTIATMMRSTELQGQESA
jgi:GT2 family glycosyltransferase